MTEKSNYWDEQWKSLTFEGIDENERYEISNYGRVRRYVQKKNSWVLMKPASVNGYPYLSFKADETLHKRKRVTKCVHRLVAEQFVRPGNKDQNSVIHSDFNKWNNYYKNLRWANKMELFEHSRKSPKTKEAIERRRGEITNAKLTETEVIRLKKKLKRGKNPLYKIAKEFGITHTQLNRIRRGENWGHIKVD